MESVKRFTQETIPADFEQNCTDSRSSARRRGGRAKTNRRNGSELPQSSVASVIAAAISDRFPSSSFLALMLGLIAFSLLGCGQAGDTPRVNEGVLDLSEWNFEANGIVTLEG